MPAYGSKMGFILNYLTVNPSFALTKMKPT